MKLIDIINLAENHDIRCSILLNTFGNNYDNLFIGSVGDIPMRYASCNVINWTLENLTYHSNFSEEHPDWGIEITINDYKGE